MEVLLIRQILKALQRLLIGLRMLAAAISALVLQKASRAVDHLHDNADNIARQKPRDSR